MMVKTTSVAQKYLASSCLKEESNNMQVGFKRLIMNLELQTLTWAQAASLQTDALIVLVSQKQAKTTGLLATMLAQAEKSGDFNPAAGQCMLWWKL